MTLKDLLKKKDKIKDEGATDAAPKGPMLSPDVPEFTFMRTTTTTQESIEPPAFPGDPTRQGPLLSPEPRGGRMSRFRRFSNASSNASGGDEHRAKSESRLADRLSFGGRNRSSSSAHVPQNLPDMGGDGVARTEEDEANWEKRATLLAKGNTLSKSGSTTPNIERPDPMAGTAGGRRPSVSQPKEEVGLCNPNV